MDKYSDEVSISPQTPEDARLMGSHGIMLRPLDDGGPEPDPDEDPTPLPPPPVSVPDVGQVLPCLEDTPGAPPGLEVKAEVIAAVRNHSGSGQTFATAAKRPNRNMDAAIYRHEHRRGARQRAGQAEPR
ncbi:MAG: hypothetical protein ACR2HJ_05755 [Fimbriimonadales bacterium]